jgi:A/G-specific adenine glycosylase
MLHILSSIDQNILVEQLSLWFRETKRNLPWRQTYDPYHVWISEIMLQQTQMERGVQYFLRWIERFPIVEDVACASEDDILSYWEGLGYYARARNLHKAAKEVTKKFSGKVPSDYKTLLTLPGVGPYTAAAVASIAGNNDVAVVDANVNRIFARIFNIDEPIKNKGSQLKVHQIANALLPKGKARIFNQALMDFGGLVCTPKSPCCDVCVVQRLCVSYKLGLVAVRPLLKPPKKSVLMLRHVAITIKDGKIFMQKRASSAVWGGLWDFPSGEAIVEDIEKAEINFISEVRKNTGLAIIEEKLLVEVYHQYTHHKVTLRSSICRLDAETGPDPKNETDIGGRWVTPIEMDSLPCPSGVRKIIKYLKKERPGMFSNNYAC